MVIFKVFDLLGTNCASQTPVTKNTNPDQNSHLPFFPYVPVYLMDEQNMLTELHGLKFNASKCSF